MSLILGIDRLIRGLVEIMLWGASLCVIALLVIGTLDVVGTQFFGVAVPSGIELQEAFMGLMLFGVLGAIQRRRAHIVVDLLTQRFGARLRAASEFLALAVGLVVFTVIAWQQWLLAARSLAIWELSPGFVAFPLWAVKLLAAIACAVAAMEFARQLVRAIIFYGVGDPEAVSPTSTITH